MLGLRVLVHLNKRYIHSTKYKKEREASVHIPQNIDTLKNNSNSKIEILVQLSLYGKYYDDTKYCLEKNHNLEKRRPKLNQKDISSIKEKNHKKDNRSISPH